MNKYIGKIIIVTNMRKIPRSCAECGYYDGMGNRPGGRYNDGICTAGASIYSISVDLREEATKRQGFSCVQAA